MKTRTYFGRIKGALRKGVVYFKEEVLHEFFGSLCIIHLEDFVLIHVNTDPARYFFLLHTCLVGEDLPGSGGRGFKNNQISNIVQQRRV
jgi:hypothetical protein